MISPVTRIRTPLARRRRHRRRGPLRRRHAGRADAGDEADRADVDDVRRFAALLELPAGAAVSELCAGRIDVTILILGHPNTSTGRALEACDAVLVPVDGPAMGEAFDGPDYTRTVIPVTAYLALPSDVPTYAVTATLVTRADTADEVVAALITDTLRGLPELAITAPILAGLDPAAMRSDGLTAPLHDGARAAFAGE